jgi:hypothetical protein
MEIPMNKFLLILSMLTFNIQASELDFSDLVQIDEDDIIANSKNCEKSIGYGITTALSISGGTAAIVGGGLLSIESQKGGHGSQNDLLSITAIPLMIYGTKLLYDGGYNLYSYFTPISVVDLMKDVKAAQNGGPKNSFAIQRFIDATTKDEISSQKALRSFTAKVKDHGLCNSITDIKDEVAVNKENIEIEIRRLLAQKEKELRESLLK